jgi:hypothetical protein
LLWCNTNAKDQNALRDIFRSIDSACCREATLEGSLARAISRFCLVAVLAEEG